MYNLYNYNLLILLKAYFAKIIFIIESSEI